MINGSIDYYDTEKVSGPTPEERERISPMPKPIHMKYGNRKAKTLHKPTVEELLTSIAQKYKDTHE